MLALLIPFSSFWEHLINSQFECIIQHSWYYVFQPLVAELYARVCINFNQPNVACLVKHEVIAKYLEIFHFVGVHVWLSLVYGRAACHIWQLFREVEYFRKACPSTSCYFSFNLIVHFLFLEPMLSKQVVKRKNIALLELSISFTMLLDGVVGQMSIIVSWVDIKLVTRCSNVSFLKEIHLLILSNKWINTNIKFPWVY